MKLVNLAAIGSLARSVREGLRESQSPERSEPAEQAQDQLGRSTPELDLATNGSPAESDPLERLLETGLVARDFRDLSQWNREKDYDWRRFGWPGNKSRARSRGRIAWAKLDTLVLHTTDTGSLHPDRFLGIPAHAGITGDGSIVLCHALNTYLYHAHAANRFSNGLEISGRQTITPEQVEAGRSYIRYWIAEVRRRKALARGQPLGPAHAIGPEPLYIIPHRHSHWSRRMDPGPDVWEALGQWAIEMLPNVRLGKVVGSGVRVPPRGTSWGAS